MARFSDCARNAFVVGCVLAPERRDSGQRERFRESDAAPSVVVRSEVLPLTAPACAVACRLCCRIEEKSAAAFVAAELCETLLRKSVTWLSAAPDSSVGAGCK